MVSIGNFRNQQLYLGANRNLSTAKATLQVNTGAAKFRPSGKTTFIKIDKLDYQPAQSKNNDDVIVEPFRPDLKPVEPIVVEGQDEVSTPWDERAKLIIEFTKREEAAKKEASNQQAK